MYPTTDQADHSMHWVIMGDDAAEHAQALSAAIYTTWGVDLDASWTLGRLAQALTECVILAYRPPRMVVRVELDGHQAAISVTVAHPRLSRRGSRTGCSTHPQGQPQLDHVHTLADQVGIYRLPGRTCVQVHAMCALHAPQSSNQP